VLDSDVRLNETRVKPQRREIHMKSAFELSHLQKFSKCWDQTQDSMKPAFNKQTWTQADEAKTRRSSNPRLAYRCKSRIWKSNTGVSLALVVQFRRSLRV